MNATTAHETAITPPAMCAGGCGRFAIARGLCSMHYRRFVKYGCLDLPSISGKRTAKQKKARADKERWLRLISTFGDVSWKSSKDFLADVGVRPAGMRLVKVDQSKPMGPGNFEWVQNRPRREFDFRTREGRVAYQRSLVDRGDQYHRRANLKRSYGITVAQYNEMFERQGGNCAICVKPERAVKNGKTLFLAVDHDHATGMVRGLLCANCNRMLGLACDDPATLVAAAQYVKDNVPGNVVRLPLKKEA